MANIRRTFRVSLFRSSRLASLIFAAAGIGATIHRGTSRLDLAGSARTKRRSLPIEEVIVDHLLFLAERRPWSHRRFSLDCGSPLPLSRPQPAVDNPSKLKRPSRLSGLAAGCLHQSGSRLPQSKRKRSNPGLHPQFAFKPFSATASTVARPRKLSRGMKSVVPLPMSSERTESLTFK